MEPSGAIEPGKGALSTGPYLMGERFSAVDILFASLLHFARGALPDDPIYDEWLARVSAQKSIWPEC